MLGTTLTPSLGLSLEFTKPPAPKEDFMDFSFVMHQFANRPQSGEVDRDGIISSKSSKKMHLISSCQHSYESQPEAAQYFNRIRFAMPPAYFNACSYHHLSLVRTDGWFRVGLPIQLLKPVELVETGISQYLVSPLQVHNGVDALDTTNALEATYNRSLKE